jgi:hypothetical protein
VILQDFPSYRKHFRDIHLRLLQVKLFILSIHVPPNPAIVSFKEQNLPASPEKTSDMKKGCERNFYTFLALDTVNLSIKINQNLAFFRELIHTKNSNNIL